MRTILIHLNVLLPDDDGRRADEIASLVEAAIQDDFEYLDSEEVVIALAEEV